MKKDLIRLGGVPEHFNLPIHLAIEKGYFAEAGIELHWTDFEGGTGQMTQALANDEADVCLLLTEGIISAILNGIPAKIISSYVKSPLIWGIHTGFASSLTHHNQIYNQKIAISRTGSGSHLMPIVDGLMNERQVKEEQFVIVNNIQGAIESLNRAETQVFYWEKYTSKPFVEKGMLKRIAEFVTPWPCFLIAASDKAIAEKGKLLPQLLKIIHRSCAEMMKHEQAPQLVSERYGIKSEDAAYWFHATEWALDSWVSEKMIDSVLFTLKKAGLLHRDPKLEELVWIRK